MLSPTGVIPEALMYPDKLGDVMTLLKQMPGTSDWKRDIFMGWARTVGVKIANSQKNAVFQTGWDLWEGA